MSDTATIQLDGIFSDWNLVKPEYRDHRGDTMHRNHRGYGDLVYTNSSGRNDIVCAKVARDSQYLYFYVETAEPISSSSDPNWMMLLINIDRNMKSGWQGYDYLINRTRNTAGLASIEKHQADWTWQKMGETDFRIVDNKMEMKIARKWLINQTNKSINFEFKWVDNIQNSGDIMDFYISGDVAPSGRFNYVYQVKDDGIQ